MHKRLQHSPLTLRSPTQGWLRTLRLLPRNAQRLTVLDGCSGMLRPGRLTLLLGWA